jgi:putative membrane protein
MNSLRSALFAALAFGPAAAFATPPTDAEILNKIHAINEAEISAGNLASTKSENKAVKMFAKDMVAKHSEADNKLADLAKAKTIALTDQTPPPDPLSAQTGVDFDRGYARKMVAGHDDALKFLATADAATQDREIKKFIEKIQPEVAHHKKMAEKLEKKLGPSKSTP